MSDLELIDHMSTPGGCKLCDPEDSTEVIIERHYRVWAEDYCRRVAEIQSDWDSIRSGMVELMTTMRDQPKIMWPPLHR